MLTICLITLGDPGTLTGGYRYHRQMAELAHRHDARVVFSSLPPRPFPLAVMHGWSALRDARDADIVLVDSIAAAFLAPWILVRRPPRLAAIAHQPPGGIGHSASRTVLQGALDLMLYRRCEGVIVASELLACRFPGRVTVVAPGRDLAAAGDKCDLRAGARAAAVCVANWLPNKGIVELLDAVAALPAGTLRLHLAGDEHADPGYRERVIRRVGRARSQVVRHGSCDSAQISRLYHSADLFVLPSRWETYGTVYAEAMTAGLPIVGWRSGNLPHLVDDGHEGVLVPPGDVKGLTGALRRVAEDEDTRRLMGRAAARRARNLPTWEQSARRFFTTLRELHP